MVSVAQSINISYVDSVQSYIDSHLKKIITTREPTSVYEPMHQLTFAPPKSTASVLCVAACELVGGSREDAIVAASSIHLMRAAMHLHERLLIGQHKNKSESEPKISRHMLGSNIELLIETGIISSAFGLLVGSINPTSNNSDKILRVIIEITRAVGAQGMVEAEANEAEFDQLRDQRSQRLHECGAICGAILGGGNEEEIEILKMFGVYV
ncbi:heterodimeric geranylgeranyl pyrophosphate synthase small subunit 2, chloroplastic-like [Rutidosis leptorrhynchoides]|uniref:heterodimeric geranylgeranyl pyrophosphate synthase small subunit 2, chloroplastic-like n=1 Tax=Rutidosis leptorrhynchoides TaxID=125765 RepID=UPI003A9A28CF